MTTAGVRVRTRNTSSNPYFLSPTPSLYLSQPHHNSVSDVKELEDGTIATCSWDGTLKIWSRRGTCLFSFSHTTQIMCFVELKNNHNGGDNSSRCNIAFGDDNGLVHVLNYRVNNSYNFNQNGRLLTFKRSHQYRPILNIVHTRDNRLATGSSDETIKIWNIETGTCIQTLDGHTGRVYSLCELSDGCLLSGSADKTIKIWRRIVNNNEVHYQLDATLEGHTNYVRSVIELKKSGLIASCSDDKSIMLWNRTSGECVRSLLGHSDCINWLVEVEDGVIVSGSSDKTVRVWRESGDCMNALSASTRITCATGLRDGSLLYGLGKDAIYISKSWMW